MARDSLVLGVVFAAVFFYVLFGVIRAAVHDGIPQADERRQQAGVGVSSGPDHPVLAP